jgi:ABC-2 type transport system ATP-binding protein
MDAIRVNALTKRFNGTAAVDELSFSVETGELFGLLGPNGAGKTATVNMLCTLLAPTSGSASVAGHDVVHEKDRVRRSIGVVFQEPALDLAVMSAVSVSMVALGAYFFEKSEAV